MSEVAEIAKRVQKEKVSSPGITIFGIPVIVTQCQRDSLLYGISGGIFCGLIAYLFTSQPRKSGRIAVGCYAGITFSYAVYCTYQENVVRKQHRLIQKVMYEAASHRSTEKKLDKTSEYIPEKVQI